MEVLTPTVREALLLNSYVALSVALDCLEACAMCAPGKPVSRSTCMCICTGKTPSVPTHCRCSSAMWSGLPNRCRFIVWEMAFAHLTVYGRSGQVDQLLVGMAPPTSMMKGRTLSDCNYLAQHHNVNVTNSKDCWTAGRVGPLELEGCGATYQGQPRGS